MAYEQCDQTVGDFVSTIADRLTDYETNYEFTTWSEELLTGYLNSAVAWLSLFRPDKFTLESRLDLVSGCNVQETPCDSFTGVVRTVGTCGKQRLPTRTSRAQGQVVSRLPEIGCKKLNAPCNEYEVTSYSYDPDSPGSFYVYPVPPVGCDIQVVVSCVSPPCYEWDADQDTPLDVPARFLSIVEEYMMYLALSKDIESAANREQAKTHYTAATTAVSGSKRGDYSQYQKDIFTVGKKDEPRIVR